MLTTMPTSPLDSLIARLRAIVDDAANSGYGTIRTQDTDSELEFTIAREKVNGRLETFESFAFRVYHYLRIGDTVEWSFAGREITLARITRKH